MKPSIGSICAHDVGINLPTKPHVLPIIASAAFDFESSEQGIDIFTGKTAGHVYSRYGNPTIEAVATKLAALEAYDLEGEACALMVSSGMAAISTLFLSLFKPGEAVLTQGNIYGGSTELFIKVMDQLNIEVVLHSLSDMSALDDYLNQNKHVRGIFFESPSNPNQECVDLSALAGVCKRYGVKTIIDNTLPTPIFQRPFNHGIDFIIHSTTKYLNGHGNAIGGAIVGCDIDFMKDKVWERMKLLGTNPSPFDVWLLHNGMKTLHIRMKAQEKHAFALATHLLSEPKINAVHYLGLKTHAHHDVAAKQMYGYGALLSMDINGGTQGAIDFMNALQICSLTPTLGDVDTLILHPATSSHLKVSAKIRANNGITDGLIRMSVGIEDVDDLIADVHQALMST